MQSRNIFETHITLLGGRISVPRCQALSKRSKLQCGKAALKGKSVCMFHGGKSTGPRTEEGRARIAAAQFKHGNRSKAAIAAQRAKAARGRAIRAELATLEAEVIGEGLLPSNWRDAYRI